MWTVLPQFGDEISLDITVNRLSCKHLPARLVDAAEDHLVVAPQRPRCRLRHEEPANPRVIAHWTDMGGGLCSMPTVLVRPDRDDVEAHWWLQATGPLSRHVRRRYVREPLPGVAYLTPDAADRVQVQGDIVDISEGGLLIRSPDAGRLATCDPVRVTIEIERRRDPIVLVGTVVRIEPLDRGGRVAVAFPDRHAYMDTIRKAVFEAELHRRRSELESGIQAAVR